MHRDLGGRQSGTGQEMWQYSQGLGEETVRALAMRCGSMDRDLGWRQEMWQYGQGPGEETVRALSRRCGSMNRDHTSTSNITNKAYTNPSNHSFIGWATIRIAKTLHIITNQNVQ